MPDNFLFWLVASTGAIVASWWLSVRPGSSMKDIQTPVSFLVVVMAVLLCLLAVTGQEPSAFAADVAGMLR